MENERNVEEKVSGPPSPARVRWAEVAAVGAILIGSAAGCEQDVSPGVAVTAQRAAATPSAAKLNATDGAGALLGRYRAFWPKMDDATLDAYVTKAASLLRSAPPKLKPGHVAREDTTTPFDDSDLLVTYRSRYNELRIEDLTRLPERRPDVDIGEQGAKARMLGAFQALVAQGLARNEDFDLNDLGTGHEMRRELSPEGKDDVTYVVQYRFRLLRKINGIDFINRGIVIGVSPDGQIASLKMGGAEVDSVRENGEERPSARGEIAARTVETSRISEHFEKSLHPRNVKSIRWARKVYMLSRNKDEAIMDPQLMYRFSMSDRPGGPVAAGEVAYSLFDGTQPPRDLASE